jgi:dihydrofolate reductase/thymidylate synthase
MFNVIIATDSKHGIGNNNRLPWHCPEELSIFNLKTKGSVLIMGRKTAQTLPVLKGRLIYCLSKSLKNGIIPNNNPTIFRTFEESINAAKKTGKTIFICGGAEIYKHVFENYKHQIDTVHMSVMKDSFECDTFFKVNLNGFVTTYSHNFEEFVHKEYKPSNNGEQQYLNLLKEILNTGDKRIGRNGLTYSMFGKHLKFDMRNGFPLLTTKKMFTRGIIEELLFFIRGDTDSTILEEKKINIWKGNTSKEFLESRKLDYPEGVMGPMYGYQWRYFNTPYVINNGKPSTKDRKGVDQFQNIINLLKTNPTSRRILMTTYNPSQVEEGVLYPCHSIIIQFYVQDSNLDIFCYNRSQDTVLGTPFNIASTALLMMIVAKLTNLTPRYFNLSMGDAHIYEQHTETIKDQIGRVPYKFPTMILPDINILQNIETLKSSDFKLLNYKHHPAIKVKMIA